MFLTALMQRNLALATKTSLSHYPDYLNNRLFMGKRYSVAKQEVEQIYTQMQEQVQRTQRSHTIPATLIARTATQSQQLRLMERLERNLNIINISDEAYFINACNCTPFTKRDALSHILTWLTTEHASWNPDAPKESQTASQQEEEKKRNYTATLDDTEASIARTIAQYAMISINTALKELFIYNDISSSPANVIVQPMIRAIIEEDVLLIQAINQAINAKNGLTKKKEPKDFNINNLDDIRNQRHLLLAYLFKFAENLLDTKLRQSKRCKSAQTRIYELAHTLFIKTLYDFSDNPDTFTNHCKIVCYHASQIRAYINSVTQRSQASSETETKHAEAETVAATPITPTSNPTVSSLTQSHTPRTPSVTMQAFTKKLLADIASFFHAPKAARLELLKQQAHSSATMTATRTVRTGTIMHLMNALEPVSSPTTSPSLPHSGQQTSARHTQTLPTDVRRHAREFNAKFETLKARFQQSKTALAEQISSLTQQDQCSSIEPAVNDWLVYHMLFTFLNSGNTANQQHIAALVKALRDSCATLEIITDDADMKAAHDRDKRTACQEVLQLLTRKTLEQFADNIQNADKQLVSQYTAKIQESRETFQNSLKTTHEKQVTFSS